VKGQGAYSKLKYEAGVHRVQRVPQTESQGRVHTSTATVAVLPEAEEIEVEIDPADVRVDVYRSTGPGGQSVNTTDSAVRLTHLPTGLVVSCQDEKSQLQNKDKAFRILRARLYQQQQEAQHAEIAGARKAQVVVFTVLLLEFGTPYEPIAIVFGAVLAMFGTVLALWLTGTSFNVVSFLGAIIGVGITAKNGILMLDFVRHLQADGTGLVEALVSSGRRRLRPVLMTSLAAALGMLPLAYGIGSGADMLRPLAIAVIGALGISVLLSLVATPTLYYVMRSRRSASRL